MIQNQISPWRGHMLNITLEQTEQLSFSNIFFIKILVRILIVYASAQIFFDKRSILKSRDTNYTQWQYICT
jgi:hypothetical protein